MTYEDPINQKDVDRYLEETEKLAIKVDCEEKAVDVLKESITSNTFQTSISCPT